jgi:hypothetical protein
MSVVERVGNIGGIFLGLEATPGTAVIPTDYVPTYESTLTTNRNLQELAPIYGNKFEVYRVVAGFNEHTGDLTTMFEPNTGFKFYDMLLTRDTTTSYYTFTVTSANATAAATYTNNGVTFTVLSTISSGTTLLCSAPGGAPSASGTLTKASGTGDATITFSTAVNTSNNWQLKVSASKTKSYTIEQSYYDVSIRYFGVQASKCVPTLNNNEIQLKTSVTALGSFSGAEIASVSGSGPYTITFKVSDGNPTPTKGLVTADLIRLFKADGNTIDGTIASVTDTSSITTTTDVSSAAAGDFLFLRPKTVTLNLLPVFKATNTWWCFGDTAADALAASATPVETASTWEIDHNMNDDKGEKRYGSPDPASIIRTTANYAVTVKKFFQDDADQKLYKNMGKVALVIRCFSYDDSGNTYEARFTFNHLVTDDPLPQLKPKEPNYSTIKYHPSFDEDDGQGMDVLFINNLNTIS